MVTSSHTNLNQSFANKIILDQLSQHFPLAEIVLLDQLYPDYKIGILTEQ